ncbi:MAG TPA: dienelactone hydrolase family protein [Planctomycetota bacterium]|nr:dienelactone hydrolase family protein [Planctomycetota bacterium]
MLRMMALLSALLLFSAHAVEIESAAYEYKIGDEVYEGFIARPKEAKDAPGVLVVHDWMGQGAFSNERATELAKLGYVAFAVDVYGKGKRGKTPQEAGALAKPFREDRKLYRDRMNAALAELLKQPGVNPKKVGAMGFCFGGTAVLELARSGADVAGVISFHGGLGSPTPEDGKNIKAKVLVLHGNLDPHVPPDEVGKFMKEMNDAKVWYRFVGYPNSVHAFTNPAAGNDLSKGAAYNAEVAAQAYEEMKAFYASIFK